jgi:hypothetical protein
MPPFYEFCDLLRKPQLYVSVCNEEVLLRTTYIIYSLIRICLTFKTLSTAIADFLLITGWISEIWKEVPANILKEPLQWYY